MQRQCQSGAAAGHAQQPLPAALQRLRGEGIELYLYPADLLLRGDANKVARTRAAMTRTELPRDAYLVSSDEGRQLQDDIARLAPFERAARAGVRGGPRATSTGVNRRLTISSGAPTAWWTGEAAIAMDRTIPPDYIGYNALYSLCYVTAIILLSFILFEDRDLA